jgi:hypothetical protein
MKSRNQVAESPAPEQSSETESPPESVALVPVASSDAELELADDPLAWLDEPERHAYTYFMANRNRRGQADTYPLAPGVVAGLFELYLNGRSLSEIRAQFPTQYGLGQIVHAAVEGKWNEQRQTYLAGLMDRAKGRALQVAAESVNFIADSMAAAHKLHGEALRKYMVSGNPKDLGAFGIGSLKQYRDLVDILMKVTGQDGNRRVAGTVKHEHTVRTIPTAPPPPQPVQAAVAALGTWAKDELSKNDGVEE